jgi:radical SAM superfamily enzyme YgiQ (UPF0313 family)
MKIVLFSTYDLGRQPFGLASPAAWLRNAGFAVECIDLSRQQFPQEILSSTAVIGFYLPMHTATRLAIPHLKLVKKISPEAVICCYGLYAPMNEAFLKSLDVDVILGGEFEEDLLKLAQRLGAHQTFTSGASQVGSPVSIARQRFQVPDRSDLPHLSRYAQLILPGGERRVVGSTEASRGCKHLCRHCPIVPIYNGQFRIVQQEIVLADIAQQVEAGATHISFGDPDFLNGPGHSLKIVRTLHDLYPQLTYDVTIKIEHLLKHSENLEDLKETGCLWVTSAVESIDDRVLKLLDKGHTKEDFLKVLERFREIGLNLSPTFVPFTPWTTREGYLELLHLLAEENLIEQVAPIQLAIRLLIPSGSKLLELPKIQQVIQGFDEASLCHRWDHEDSSLDELSNQIRQQIRKSEVQSMDRKQVFNAIWQLSNQSRVENDPAFQDLNSPLPHAGIPHLSEAWYCCAEPNEDQLARV